MVDKIPLKSGSVEYVCTFCGYATFDEQQAMLCEASGGEERYHNAGDIVELFYPQGRKRSSGTLRWRIVRIAYFNPHDTKIQLPPHTLYVVLKSKSRVPTDLRFALHRMTYQNFILWQKGDLQELFEAGLIQEPVVSPSVLQLFFARIAESIKRVLEYPKKQVKRIFS